MKYIIVEDQGIEVAVLFSELLKHDAVAGSYKVVAAGHCDGHGSTWGQSVSLGLKSRPQDAAVVKHTMEWRGI